MQTLTGVHAHVMVALRADLEVTLQLGAVQHLPTTIALGPHPFRDAGFARWRGSAFIQYAFNPAH
jgi:hypothetical protein